MKTEERNKKRRKNRRDRKLQLLCYILVGLIVTCNIVLLLSSIFCITTTDESVNADGVSMLIIEQKPYTFENRPEITIIEPVDVIEQEEDIEHVEEIEPEPYLDLSSAEKESLATLIWLEGRGESIDCQYAIGSTILNRYTTGTYGDLLDVIYEDGQFAPADLIQCSTPTDMQIAIAEELCFYGPTIPEYITYFRASHFHDWGNDFPVPYNHIDNTYFSYDPALVMQCMENANTY